MSIPVPWGKIPDTNLFETGIYHVEGVKMEKRFAGNGKLMYSIDVKVLDHPNTVAYTNKHFFNNFVIGSDDDLEAELEGTWIQSFGAKNLKQMMNAAQMTMDPDMDKNCVSFQGCQFMIGIRKYEEPAEKNGMPNQYAGQERNDISGYFKIGTREPRVDAPAAKAAPAPAAPPPPGQGPVVGQPAIQAATTPVAAPPQPAGPAPAQTAPPTPAAPASGAGGQAVATLPCNQCGEQIPTTEFAAHFQQCLTKATNG